MEMDVMLIAQIAGAAIVAAILTWFFVRKSNVAIEKVAKEKGDAILKEAEVKGELIKKDKLMEAKDKFYQMKTDHEKMIADKDRKANEAENRIKQKEKEASIRGAKWCTFLVCFDIGGMKITV